jgi:hypothetical protein
LYAELEGFQPEILVTVADPDSLYYSPSGIKPNFAGAVKVLYLPDF